MIYTKFHHTKHVIPGWTHLINQRRAYGDWNLKIKATKLITRHFSSMKKKKTFSTTYHPDEKCFIWEHIVIKTFESCTYWKIWLKNRWIRIFEEREQQEITNHQRQILKNIKIMSLRRQTNLKVWSNWGVCVWKHNFDLYLGPWIEPTAFTWSWAKYSNHFVTFTTFTTLSIPFAFLK